MDLASLEVSNQALCVEESLDREFVRAQSIDQCFKVNIRRIHEGESLLTNVKWSRRSQVLYELLIRGTLL